MIHYLLMTVAVAYWFVCGLTLFYIMINEKSRLLKGDVAFDLGISLVFGGIFMPLLVGATTIYFVTKGIKR